MDLSTLVSALRRDDRYRFECISLEGVPFLEWSKNGSALEKELSVIEAASDAVASLRCFMRVDMTQRCTSKDDTVALLLDTDTLPQSVWPASRPIASFLLRTQLCRGKRVVELGAGVGLVGIAAAFSEAQAVLLTDSSPVSLALLEISVEALGHPLNQSVKVHHLVWGDAEMTDSALQSLREICECTKRVGDVSDVCRADIVLGSDIFYFRSSLRRGLATARSLLAPGGEFWCGSSVRSDQIEDELDCLPAEFGFGGGCVAAVASLNLRLYRWVLM